MKNRTQVAHAQTGPRRFGIGCWLVLLLTGAVVASGQDEPERQGDAEPQTESEETAVPATPEEYLTRLEWRGVLAVPEGTLFSIHDPAAGESFWIALGEERGGIEVVDYHREESSVTVGYEGAFRTLALSGASVRPLEEASPESSPTFAGAERSSSADENGGETDDEDGGDLWLQAVAESEELQEIDEQLQVIEAAEEENAEKLAQAEPGGSGYNVAVARREELQEARNRLAEMALTELEKSPNLSEETRRALLEELRPEADVPKDSVKKKAPVSKAAEAEAPAEEEKEDEELLK